MSILAFTGKYKWLSNFAFAPVLFEDAVYPTVEHAYQAAKTFDPAQRALIQSRLMPASAKKLGRTVTLRPDWERVKVTIMTQLVRQKFQTEPYKTYLLTTDGEIVEGNWWGDIYWGVCNGEGQNMLGKIIMEIREELRNEYRNP